VEIARERARRKLVLRAVAAKARGRPCSRDDLSLSRARAGNESDSGPRKCEPAPYPDRRTRTHTRVSLPLAAGADFIAPHAEIGEDHPIDDKGSPSLPPGLAFLLGANAASAKNAN